MADAQAVPTETAVPVAGAEVFAMAQADEAFNAFRCSLDEAQRKVVDEALPIATAVRPGTDGEPPDKKQRGAEGLAVDPKTIHATAAALAEGLGNVAFRADAAGQHGPDA